MISADQIDWYDKLPLAEFAINSAVSSTTGFAPFELNYTCLPRIMQSIQLEQAENKGVKELGVKEIDNHCWKGKTLQFHVQWDDGDDTWESYNNVKECMALDDYLALKGVIKVGELPKGVPHPVTAYDGFNPILKIVQT